MEKFQEMKIKLTWLFSDVFYLGSVTRKHETW